MYHQIKFTDHVLQVCRQVVDQCPDNGDSPLIMEALQQLAEIERELGEFATSCSHVKKGKDDKAKKRKWLLEGGKLEKIRKKASNARMHLQTALICHQSMLMSLQQNQ